PRNRSACRASTSAPSAASAAAPAASSTRMKPGCTSTSPGPGSDSPVSTGSPAATQAGYPPSSTRTSASPAHRSTHQARAATPRREGDRPRTRPGPDPPWSTGRRARPMPARVPARRPGRERPRGFAGCPRRPVCPTQRVEFASGRAADVNDLVDTTEMYLRTILELEEEGVVPLRARIAERLHQSGPTVSQTVNRMERDGLLTVEGDRHLALTDAGRAHAVAVMRKHRLAELLLVKIIGMPYEEAH